MRVRVRVRVRVRLRVRLRLRVSVGVGVRVRVRDADHLERGGPPLAKLVAVHVGVAARSDVVGQRVEPHVHDVLEIVALLLVGHLVRVIG